MALQGGAVRRKRNYAYKPMLHQDRRRRGLRTYQ